MSRIFTGDPMEQDSSMEDTRWLAYELHDGLLQWIVSAHLNLESVTEKLGASDSVSEPVRNLLGVIHTNIANALDEARQLIKFLENPTLKRASGHRELMEFFLASMQFDAERNQQTIQLEMDADVGSGLDDRTSWNLMRILQQAVQNAIQHAGPCRIALIGRKADSGDTVWRVSDTGVGFDPGMARTSREHFGLPGMAHRARLIGADLKIESQPGAGTRLEVRLKGSGVAL